MNEIVNKFLLAEDKFIPEMHLRQPGFMYSPCGLFTKNKKRIRKFKETGDSPYIYQNELDKAFFQHDMAYGDFKDLNRRTVIKHLILLKIQNMIYINVDFFQWFMFSDKKTSASGIKNENISNKPPLNLARQLLNNYLIKEKYNHILLTIFGGGGGEGGLI